MIYLYLVVGDQISTNHILTHPGGWSHLMQEVEESDCRLVEPGGGAVQEAPQDLRYHLSTGKTIHITLTTYTVYFKVLNINYISDILTDIIIQLKTDLQVFQILYPIPT